MPGRTKTKRKVKTKLSAAETLRRWRAIIGVFSKKDIPNPVAWQRAQRKDRRILQ